MQFTHLHVHTQFSLLDGAADISKLMHKAKADGMKAIAMTDHGNMFGAFKFVAEAQKNGIKPIVGCEFYMVADRHKKQFTKENKDQRFHQLLLAKDHEGYKNLSKLCSLGFIEGLYSKWPRIDKELLLKYHKGLIATTCCLGAEVPRTILSKGEEEGEKIFKWYLDIFGEDYYIELQRHGIDDQEKVNIVLLKFAKKYNVKIICSNDSHYVDQEDANAHDILLCVNTGDLQETPKATDEEGGKGYRFGFPNDEFFFKTTSQMEKLFHDLPQSLDNTNEIIDKVSEFSLKRDILVPNFPIPPGYLDGDDYLRHLTFKGAAERYSNLSAEIEERLNFELHVIKTMGFPGYFLIVADFIREGRDMGVIIGPGRGSAAGSAVAYCIGVTNIDPIKYGLLFERFLNPERKSMPDIDTDFDDVGRQKVLDYVVEKYGRNQVAQIINYGTMAAKSAIKDVARVLNLPLADSTSLTKLVPDKAGTNLVFLMTSPIEKVAEEINADDLVKVKQLRKIISDGNTPQAKVLKEALKLEGSVRNTGIHASAVIIAPHDLMEYIPLTVAKDSDLLVTQFDGKIIEDAGLLKMDFLGLKTLTIIKTALDLIEKNHQVKIDIDTVPLDDQKTYELFQRGDTVAIFQFESPGMQKYLKDLKPDKFEDLIAMNALYRPGPMEHIPKFIKRKHGLEETSYDFEVTADLLKETYGVTVYQEQVMLLSQLLANFTKGDADTLRKAMGKKQKDVLDKMKPKFLDGCKANGHDLKIAEKVWVDWEAFASYAFNKSHATCYSFIAFQTAYLKAHYPAEYMAATLNSQNNIEDVTFFMEECRKIRIPVLGPDVNESSYGFAVNAKGEIRFGLTGIKGVGEKAVDAIIAERENAGPFRSVFEFVRRNNMRTVNKKSIENLVYSGSFDSFKEINRAQYFGVVGSDRLNGIEKLIKYGSDYQNNLASSQNSLFGDSGAMNIEEPSLPYFEEWRNQEKLAHEKEMIGIYLSGHPLDVYRMELENFCNVSIAELKDPVALKGRDLKFGGMVSSVSHRISQKNGNPFGNFTIEDLSDNISLTLFSEKYLKWKHFLDPLNVSTGLFLFVQAKAEKRKFNDEWEIAIYNIQLLAEIKDKMAKGVVFMLPLGKSFENQMNVIADMVKSNPGNLPVRFKFTDPVDNVVVEMTSRSLKIEMNQHVLDQIQSDQDIQCKLM